MAQPQSPRLRSESGFTLIELVITLLLLLVVLTAITVSLVAGMHAETNTQNRLRAQQDARAALATMRADIHCSYGVQSVVANSASAANPSGLGYTMSLSEFTNKCAAVAQSLGGSSQVYVAWCTLPNGNGPTYSLYRSTGSCDATGNRMASDVVAPPGAPSTWNGKIWPSVAGCSGGTGTAPTQPVDLAVNPDPVGSPNETYELKDQIVLRNASRCGAGGSGGQATPTLTVSAPGTGTTGVAIPGSSITASISGGSSPTGTITFSVFQQTAAPATCTGGTQVGTAAVNGNGTVPSGASFTPTVAGTYWWLASYGGDDGNSGVDSGCSTVKTVVTSSLANTTLSVAAPSTGTTNVAIAPSSITATLGGGSSPSGAITFYVYGPNANPTACPGGSGWTNLGSATVTANGIYSPSVAFTPATAGTYWWYAEYSGDTANNPAKSTCGSAMASTAVASGPQLQSAQVFDDDHDGKVDRIVATFTGSGTGLSCTGSCAVGWSFSPIGAASGATIAAVSITGWNVTLNLAEGTGLPDTANDFSISLGSTGNILDQSSRKATGGPTTPADKAPPVPIGVVSFQSGGSAGNGKMEAGDKLQVTFSEPIAAPAFPLSSLTTKESRGNNGNVTLTITNVAAASDTGSHDYLTGSGNQSASFTGGSAALSGGTVLTVTVGATGGGSNLAASSGVFQFVPDVGLKDAAGNAAAGTFVSASIFKLF